MRKWFGREDDEYVVPQTHTPCRSAEEKRHDEVFEDFVVSKKELETAESMFNHASSLLERATALHDESKRRLRAVIDARL